MYGGAITIFFVDHFFKKPNVDNLYGGTGFPEFTIDNMWRLQDTNKAVSAPITPSSSKPSPNSSHRHTKYF